MARVGQRKDVHKQAVYKQQRLDCRRHDLYRMPTLWLSFMFRISFPGVQNASYFHCKLSSNHVHTMGLIYRPFMLYVWDNSDYIPLLVQNKAAEILFGNISAEKVHQSYKEHKADKFHSRPSVDAAKAHKPNETGNEGMNIASTSARVGSGISEKKHGSKSPDFCAIWLILVKMLLLQGKNSPFQFEALVTPSLEKEDGKFEMIGVSMPCVINHSISANQEEEEEEGLA